MKIVLNKPTLTRNDLEGVLDSLINDDLITGVTVKNFETRMSEIVNLKYSLAANSVTAAYHLIFRVMEIDNNSEIIIPSFFCQAPLSALTMYSGKAVLVDNEKNSLFPSIDMIKEKISENTRAIIIGHTFGYHFPTDELKKLNVPIIEDISHALGTEYNDNPVGFDSTFAVLSFAPSMIITTGNGGMVLTNNSKYYSEMRGLRGINSEHLHLDYNMTDFQAAMGLSQLSKLQKLLKRRREIAKIYYDAIRLSVHKSIIPYNEKFSYQSFPVLFDALTEKITKYWKKCGIETIKPVENPLHKLLKIRGLEYPNCDRMSKKMYSLPIYPTLTRKEIEKISKSLSNFI